MSITYEDVTQEILNVLGAVKGATAAVADTNFAASPTTSTVIGPDFVPRMIYPALAATLGEIVEAIATTPRHLERQRYADVTSPLLNQAEIPETGAGGDRIIGIPGFVRDAVDEQACSPASLDAIRSFNRFPAVYADQDPYLYCINGGRIEHTRTNVVIEVCVFIRPTTFAGDIPLEVWHEGGLVWGSVMKLALKESMFQPLYNGAKTCWDAHLASIAKYAEPSLYGMATAAPSSQ
jgi:hypothetical protein